MKRKAFVLGANRNALQYAESDAAKISSGLAGLGFLTTGIELKNSSTDRIIHALRSFLLDLEKTDTFIFFFAGHSFRFPTDNVLLLAINSSDLSKRETCISANVLLDLIQACRAENKLVVLDSCEAAGIFSSVNINQRNFSIIVAAEAWEKTPEIEMIKGGLLSHLLHRALTGNEPEALTRTGHLTTNSLFDWISTRVNKFREQYGPKIPKIIKGGTQNQPFVIASFSEQMDTATQITLEKLEMVVDKAKAVRLPTSLADQLKYRRLQAQLEFEKEKLAILDEEISILRKDYLLAGDNLQKKRIERLIQAREEEVEEILAGLENIEATLYS